MRARAERNDRLGGYGVERHGAADDSRGPLKIENRSVPLESIAAPALRPSFKVKQCARRA